MSTFFMDPQRCWSAVSADFKERPFEDLCNYFGIAIAMSRGSLFFLLPKPTKWAPPNEDH